MSDSWIVNLSDKSFSDTDLSVLKLDPKFQIVPSHINREQIIANIESRLNFMIKDKPKIESIRIALMNNLKNCNPVKCNLSKGQLNSIKKLKNMHDIIITNSDKGNKTVVMNKSEYISKIMSILSDQNIYQEQYKDNTRSIANKLIEILKIS